MVNDIRVLGGLALVIVVTHAQSFEVASVRLHPAAVNAPMFKNPGVNPIRISGNRVVLQGVTLKDLIMAAYNVQDVQVSGGPAWASGPESVYDIAANAGGDGALDMDRARTMLRNLLAERFQLHLRDESKEVAIYNLAIAKNGAKLKKIAADSVPTPGNDPGTMEQLAGLVALYLDRPVFDKTGLTGMYEWGHRIRFLDIDAAPGDLPSKVFAELDGLGLKAEAARGTVEMLTIVSAEKPSPN